MTSRTTALTATLAKPLFVIPAEAGIRQTGGMREEFSPTVYLLAPRPNGTLYVGVTSNLLARLHQHREGTLPGFTRTYGARRLVWFEQHETMETAIQREKRIKKWNRAWKIRLIVEANPQWRDLAEEFGFEPLT
jgi:putative endonuclease